MPNAGNSRNWHYLSIEAIEACNRFDNYCITTWPRMRGLPCGYPILNIGKFVGRNMGADHLPVGRVFLLIRSFHLRGQVQPVVGLHIALRDALAHGVKHAERCLRARISLLGGFAIPGAACAISRGKPLPRRDRARPGGAGPAMSSLLGCFAVPLRRLFVILRHNLAVPHSSRPPAPAPRHRPALALASRAGSIPAFEPPAAPVCAKAGINADRNDIARTIRSCLSCSHGTLIEQSDRLREAQFTAESAHPDRSAG